MDGTVDVATVDLDPATPGIQTSLTTAAGSYTVNNTGQVTFSPVGSFTGVTAIPYTVNDNLGLTSLTALITIGVGAGVPPVALADNATTPSGTSTTICVLANDSNSGGSTATTATVTAPVFTQPANGTVTTGLNGCLVFTPTPGFSGTTVFSYTICDPVTGLCDNATVTVTVLNQPPVANPDNTTTGQGVPVSLVVTLNDTDVDGTVDVATVDLDPATPGIQTSLTTAAGSYTVNNTGQVTFSPVGSFTGVTAIPYTVNDNLGLTSLTALITIGVGAGVPPVALADNATTPSGTSTTICVLANDSNSGGTGATTATVTAPVFTQPANGTVTAGA